MLKVRCCSIKLMKSGLEAAPRFPHAQRQHNDGDEYLKHIRIYQSCVLHTNRDDRHIFVTNRISTLTLLTTSLKKSPFSARACWYNCIVHISASSEV